VKTERAREMLAECLGLPIGEIGADARLGSPAAWDSLAHVRIVLALEAECGRELSAQEILGLTSLKALAGLL
jgi:acyl carrier protein